MAVNHTFTILCDDVRREDNGKLIVLGMYMGTIAVPMLPMVMPTLTVLALFTGDRPEQWSWRMAIQHLERGKTLVEARGFANVQQPGPGAMPVKFGGVRFDAAGAYNIVLHLEGQREPIELLQFAVMLAPQMLQGQAPFQQRV